MQTAYCKPGKYLIQKPDYLLTKGKFVELKNKLDRLKNKRPEVADEVRRLAELGDFSENVEYQLAKGRLRGINNAILKLENQINQAVIIKPQKQTDTIQVGHYVTIEIIDKPFRSHLTLRQAQGEQKTYQILGSSETNPQKGIISHLSPIGSALIGRKIGDVIKIKLANKEVEYRIIKIG